MSSMRFIGRDCELMSAMFSIENRGFDTVTARAVEGKRRFYLDYLEARIQSEKFQKFTVRYLSSSSINDLSFSSSSTLLKVSFGIWSNPGLRNHMLQ